MKGKLHMKRTTALLLTLLMSGAAVLFAAAESEYILTAEQAELERKYEEITFSELMAECRNVWIGEVLSIQDYENVLLRPEPQLEVVVDENGQEILKWVDRHTEQWQMEGCSIELHVLDTLRGYTYTGLPMRFESTYLAEQYVSLTDDAVLKTAFRTLPSLETGEKLLIFGAPYYWGTREQFLVSESGNVACTYKTGASDSNGGVAIDDLP